MLTKGEKEKSFPILLDPDYQIVFKTLRTGKTF